MTSVIEDQRSIRALAAYRIVSRGYFHLSVLFVFLLAFGHSVAAVSLVLAAYGFTMAVSTTLTRDLVARLGPATALVGGELLKGAGLALLALTADSLPMAILAQAINAVGFSLANTADPVLASRLASAERMRSLQASMQSWMFVALLISGVAGGALYLVRPELPIFAGALAALIAAGIAATLRSKTKSAPEQSDPPAVVPEPGKSRMVPSERGWVTYYVLTRGFMLGAFVGLLPFLIFHLLGVGVLGLTVILAGYSLAAFVMARYSGAVIDRIGLKTMSAATAIALLASFGIFALSGSIVPVVVAMILLGAASGGVRPTTIGELALLARIHRGGTTPGWLIARMEGAFGLCNAAVILFGGLVIQLWSFGTALVCLCVAYVIVQGIAFYLTRHPASTRGK